MNVIKNDVNGYKLNPNQIGFKSDAPIMPVPGVTIPIQEQDMSQYHQGNNTELPDIYYMPDKYKKPKTFVEKLKKVDLFGLVAPWFEHPLLMLGTAAGISASVDAFDKSCNKEYEKSIVGKAAKFGDKIEKSNFVQKEGTQKFIQKVKDGWKKFKTTLKKNDVINAMVESPSKPEWSAPKQELKTTNCRIVDKFRELSSKIGLIPNAGSVREGAKLNLRLNDLVPDNAEREYIKKTYNVNRISKAPREEAVNRIMLKRLGKTEAEISAILSGGNATDSVIKELIKKSDLTEEELKKIFKDETGETINLVKKASENLKNIKVTNGRLVLPGEWQPFVNVESERGIFNRIHSITEGAKTNTGRFMSKLVQKIHKMFTFGSNKMGVLIWITPILAETVISTIKADKKEKVGTVVSGLINAFAWVLYFPLVLKAIYALGGVQYAGMGKDNVQNLKNKIEAFNARTKPDNDTCFKNIKEYREAKRALKKELNALRKVDNQNFLTKTLRGISKFTKSDLLKIESFQGGSKVENFFRRIPNKMKDFFLGRGRFVFFIIAAIPLVDKMIEKTTSKLFGKGYDRYKDSEMESEKEAQEQYTMQDLKTRITELYQNKSNPENTQEAQKNAETAQNAPFTPLIPESMKEMANNADLNDELLNTENTEQIGINNPVSPVAENKNNEDNINPSEIEMNPQDETISKEDTPIVSENKKRDNYTYIPSSENILKDNNPTQPINKYIPAQTPAKFVKTFDNSGLEAALRRAERAEKRALDVLAGNFGNY